MKTTTIPDHLAFRPPTTPTQLNPQNAAVNSNPTPNFSNADPPQPKKRRLSSKDDKKRRPKITEPCTECGRTFWSWKALFGHMRCHPDRLWRGIHPPPPRPVVNAATSSPDEYHSMTEDDHFAASSLLILAAGPHQLLLSAEDQENDCRFGFSSSSTSCKKAALAVHHKKIDKNSVKGSSSTNTVIKDFLTRHYECNVCSKVFSSGQALGGHKRWHWERAEHAAAASVVTTMTTQVAGLMSSDSSSIGNVDLNLPAVSAPVSEDDSSLGMGLDLRLGL